MKNTCSIRKSLIPFKLINNNTYLFYNTGSFSYNMFVHPQFISSLDKEGTDYYARKARYLRDKIPVIENKYNGRMHPDQVKNGFSNTNQIVFEVTDSCNLNCIYCGYGQLYGDYDKRENKFLSTQQIIPLFNYMNELWKENGSQSIHDVIYISFYGGEPLINMKFIQEVVHYIEEERNDEHTYIFSMTTNGVLLDKYMDFLVKHKFHLLLSLDGNEKNNAYRVTKQGKGSFEKITQNIDLLQQTYPDYFEEYVQFNAVLHNKNSVEEIYNHIYNRYGKLPHIGELNNSGIVPEKRDEFEKMYRNTTESLNQSEHYSQLEKSLFTGIPSYYNACNFLHNYNPGIIKTYNDFYKSKPIRYIPTGTCMPFSKKIFITVNGKILPCERIGHQFSLGSLSEAGVTIDFKAIADKYNAYYDKLENQCTHCYQLGVCHQCLFNVETIDEKKAICYGFMNRKQFTEYIASNISFFETHPEDYFRIMEEVIIK